MSAMPRLCHQPDAFCRRLEILCRTEGAPVVLAMGRGHMAMQIIERAKEARVRTLRIPMLARAVFTSEIGSEITEGLCNAVAVVLAYVFRLDDGEQWRCPN